MDSKEKREPAYVDLEVVAEELDISRGSAYAAVAKGQIPHIRIGRLIRVPVKWLRDQYGAAA
jgi:excisionase family DNA binding protein